MNTLHKRMISEICKYFGVQFQEIFTRRRYKKLVYAKKVIYWILRREGLTYNQIARLVQKDHETIIVGVRSLPETYKEYALSLFKKYKKYGLREKKYKEEDIFIERMNNIAEYLNKGYTEEQIAKILGYSCQDVLDDISLYIEKKKVPDYSFNSKGFKIMHFFSQKNKKNY